MSVDDNIDGWSMVSDGIDIQGMGASPKCSPLPLPSSLRGHVGPRIPAPFQVHEGPNLPSRPVQSRPFSVSSVSQGAPQPRYSVSHVSSLTNQFHRIQSIQSSETSGLPAPTIHKSVPRSQKVPASVQDKGISLQIPVHSVVPLAETHGRPSTGPFKHSQSHHESSLTRVRLAANSAVVLQLWIQFEQVFSAFSVTIQQMQSSVNYAEHRNRFLNQFAATTLVKYMTAALQFIRLCQVLQLDLSSLSAWHLADVLIAGSMARRSDGTGPKSSMAIKALRWCYKQLQISLFQEIFNPMILSFDKQKFPTDR